MSKKRKTRKEKEKAQLRHHIPVEIQQPTGITYSIPKTEKKIETHPLQSGQPAKNHISTYLMHDIRTIIAATGIILAFEILLYALTSTGTLRLGFLGY